MNISITDSNAPLKYTQSNHLILAAYKKRAVRFILMYVALAAAFITYDLATFSDWSWQSGIGPNATYHSLHVFLIIGFILAIRSIAYLVTLSKYEHKFLSDLRATLKRSFEKSAAETITLSDELVSISSEHSHCEYKWHLITSYMVKGDFIFLPRHSSIAYAITINTSLLSSPDLEELMAYLKKHKPETKSFHKPV